MGTVAARRIEVTGPHSFETALQRVADRFCHIFRTCGSPQVRCERAGGCCNTLDRRHQSMCRFVLVKMFEHHRCGPERSQRIGNSFAHDVERGAVNRLEHGRPATQRIEVRCGPDAKTSRESGRKIDLGDIARGYGCETLRVEKADELAAALTRSFSSAGPIVLDVIVDRAEIVLY